MLVIISGTNRRENRTRYFAKYALERIRKMDAISVGLIDLAEIAGIPTDGMLYDPEARPPTIRKLQDTLIIPATKFWFFIPEYNGSYPGIVKLLLDAFSVRDRIASFESKKACITGISSGRAGNLRGMDHLSDVLGHLGVIVHPNRVPISCIHNVLAPDNKLINAEVEQILEKQILQITTF